MKPVQAKGTSHRTWMRPPYALDVLIRRLEIRIYEKNLGLHGDVQMSALLCLTNSSRYTFYLFSNVN